MQESKRCAECDRLFLRAPNRSDAQWAAQLCCSRRCANAIRAREHNPMSDATVRGRHSERVSAGWKQSAYRRATEQRREAKRVRLRRIARRTRAVRKLQASAVGQRGATRWISGPCANPKCDVHFVRRKSQSRCCSKPCRRAIDRRKYRHAYGSHRHRARHYGVEYKSVKRTDIFRRDGYRCQCCGRKTKRKHRRSDGTVDPLAATLDHIVPMVKGGGHVESNL